jgi:hypothetical protein
MKGKKMKNKILAIAAIVALVSVNVNNINATQGQMQTILHILPKICYQITGLIAIRKFEDAHWKKFKEHYKKYGIDNKLLTTQNGIITSDRIYVFCNLLTGIGFIENKYPDTFKFFIKKFKENPNIAMLENAIGNLIALGNTIENYHRHDSDKGEEFGKISNIINFFLTLEVALGVPN